MKIERSKVFTKWFNNLRDLFIKDRILKRLERITEGNLGDVKSVGDGVYEIRIDYGPGYRIYYGYKGETIVILLCGGDKSTQKNDIKKAKEMIL